jgi:hypothetical protein
VVSGSVLTGGGLGATAAALATLATEAVATFEQASREFVSVYVRIFFLFCRYCKNKRKYRYKY